MQTKITEELRRRILILDGGLGTMIQRYGFSEEDFRGERFAAWGPALRGCNDLLVLTRPDAILEIHGAYLAAGADIVSTDTFNANAVSLADYGLQEQVYEINRAAAALARTLADDYTRKNPAKPRFVAGSVGGTNKMASMLSDFSNPAARAVTFQELAAAYRDQLSGLLDGGADVILFETVFDTLNVKAALFALGGLCEERGVRVPVMVSATLTDGGGRLLSGQTLEAFYASVRPCDPLSVGLNCSFGAGQMFPYMERIARIADCALSVHPNAGLPNAAGGYDETPETMADALRPYFDAGLLNIVGGCCGTTPAHIEAIARLAAGYTPRTTPAPDRVTRLSGLEEWGVTGSGLTIIGDRASVDDPGFAMQIREKAYERAAMPLSAEIAAGAEILGVCLDDDAVEGADAMRDYLNTATADPGVARAPMMVDSFRRKTWESGLACLQGKSLVNAISLKRGDAAFVELARLVRRYGAVPIVRLADEEGEAVGYERKMSVAERAFRLLTEAGFPATEIVFDPLLGALAPDMPAGSVADFIRTCRSIRAQYPGVRTVASLSAFTRSLAGNASVRSACHSVFLRRAVEAGLNLAIVDPAHLTVYGCIAPDLRALCEALVDGTAPDAAAKLIDYAERRMVAAVATDVPADFSGRLLAAVAAGQTQMELSEDLTPVSIAGAVEQLYVLLAAHELFLPQLLAAGRIVRQAVMALGNTVPDPEMPMVLLPPLKSDPGDLIRNGLKTLLLAEGYRIEEVGGTPTPERVVAEAANRGADAIVMACGAAGREEIEVVADVARRQGLTIPVLAGGPAVSGACAPETPAPRLADAVAALKQAFSR